MTGIEQGISHEQPSGLEFPGLSLAKSLTIESTCERFLGHIAGSEPGGLRYGSYIADTEPGLQSGRVVALAVLCTRGLVELDPENPSVIHLSGAGQAFIRNPK